MSRFAFSIFDTQSPAVSRELPRDRITGVRFTTVHPGGCGELSFRVPASTRVVPIWAGYNFEVRVLDGGDVFWSGRMDDLTAHRGPDGEWWQVGVHGFAVNLDDQVYTSQDVNNTQTSTIVTNGLSSLTQQIDANSITATGFTLSAATAVNLKLLTAAQVAQWVKQFGDSSNNPQVWYVYPDTDGTVRFTLKDRPTTPDVVGSAADFTVVDFGLRGRQLANRVVVMYNAGASFVTVNDTTLQGAGPAGWNLIRTAIAVIPEITQSADATQAANAILTQVKSARMAASNLALKPPYRILDSNGQYLAPWRARAGTLFQFRDIDPAEGYLGTLAYNNSFLVAGTSFDEDSQALTITPESYDLTLEQIVARVRALLRGRHTV